MEDDSPLAFTIFVDDDINIEYLNEHPEKFVDLELFKIIVIHRESELEQFAVCKIPVFDTVPLFGAISLVSGDFYIFNAENYPLQRVGCKYLILKNGRIHHHGLKPVQRVLASIISFSTSSFEIFSPVILVNAVNSLLYNIQYEIKITSMDDEIENTLCLLKDFSNDLFENLLESFKLSVDFYRKLFYYYHIIYLLYTILVWKESWVVSMMEKVEYDTFLEFKKMHQHSMKEEKKVEFLKDTETKKTFKVTYYLPNYKKYEMDHDALYNREYCESSSCFTLDGNSNIFKIKKIVVESLE